MKRKGGTMLVSIIGLNGCGKSTQVALLKKHLERKGYRVSVSKAYGEGEKRCFGNTIGNWKPLIIMLFFKTLQCWQRLKARRALKRGEIVIADLWDEYDLASRPENKWFYRLLNRAVFAGIVPDLTLFLDLPVETATQRNEKKGKLSFFDRQPKEYHEKMRQGYLRLVKERSGIVLDASQTKHRLHCQIKSYFLALV